MVKNRFLLILILGVFLISFANALEDQPLEKVGYEWDNVGQFTRDETTSEYGKYEIRNAVLGLSWFQYGQVADIELINNSDYCGENCFAEKEITLYDDGILVDEITFETLQPDGSWKYQPIRSYQFSYQGEIQDYKTVCDDIEQSENGTTIQECNQVEDGTHIGKINYKEGEVVKAGTYLLRLNGRKKPSRTVDWKIKTNGIWTNEWAVWGNISLGDDAEVILNSPLDNEVSLIQEVEFNCSANVTEGASLVNMSLWTNKTGTWEISDTGLGEDGILNDEQSFTNPTNLFDWNDATYAQKTYSNQPQDDTYSAAIGQTFDSRYVGDVTIKTTLAISGFIEPLIKLQSYNGVSWSTISNLGTTSYDDTISINTDTQGLRLYYQWRNIGPITNSADIKSYVMKYGSFSNFATTATVTWDQIITEPTLWTCQSCDSDEDCGFATENRTILIDTVAPILIVENPTGVLDYNFIGGNETLNVTFTDSNLESCWYDYNGTNITIEGCLTGIKNSTQFILEADNLNMTLYANDSVGNLNSTFINWDYSLFEKELIYNSNITEGEENVISIKVIINELSSITNSFLVYNGENLTTTIIYDGENYTIISTNAAPIVDEDRNITFKFFISVDGIEYETNSNNQTVVNQDFGICGGISNDTLLNMSLFDEETLVELIGDIEFNARIISKSSGDTIGISNTTFSDVHSGAVCFSPIESYPLYFLDAEIRYSRDDYVTEFYHIQKADLADYPNNLSLFSLNENDSTEFSVTYKNNAFLFVEGVVIQLQRKYIGEDIYRTVEAPITGEGGETILHIDLNTIKYRASVVKDGELLDFFENIVFNCDNELSGDCTHSLDGTVSPNNDIPIETITDFTYSVSIDEDEKEVTVLFTVPSGTSSTINVQLTQLDMFGNLTACNTTVITSAGSITCGYTDSIEANILELSISKNNVQLAILNYANNPELDMDGMNFFIIFLFMISLVGMAISSPEWMLIISIMVLMISGFLLLVSGMNLVMGLGAIAWLVVAVGIIIMKMAKQEDR